MKANFVKEKNEGMYFKCKIFSSKNQKLIFGLKIMIKEFKEGIFLKKIGSVISTEYKWNRPVDSFKSLKIVSLETHLSLSWIMRKITGKIIEKIRKTWKLKLLLIIIIN